MTRRQLLAGVAAGAAAASAITGRTLVGWLMPVGADRRLFTSASYVVQIVGSIAFLLAAGDNIALLLLSVILFRAGIGNATSLPPLIAQGEFVPGQLMKADRKAQAQRRIPTSLASNFPRTQARKC